MYFRPLFRVNEQDLDPFFREEIEHWEKQLFWDYEPAVRLIKRHVSAGNLRGWLCKSSTGEGLGYSYYVVNPPVAHIGNLFVKSDAACLRIYTGLLDRTLDALKQFNRLRRIESQIFTFNCELRPLFEQRGFHCMKRHFLFLRLADREAIREPGLPSGYRLLQWHENLFFEAAETIHNAYRGSADYELCYEYRSQQGCMRLLRNLLGNPGCGNFDSANSFLVLDPNKRVCAVLIASRIGPSTSMIPQLSVRRDSQGKGIGALLLETYLQQAEQSGVDRVTLSVSAKNTRAHRLYSQLGFHRRKDFYAFVKEMG